MRAPCLSGMCKICTNHKIVCFNPKDCENACRTSQVLVQLYVSRLLYVMRLHTSSAQGHLPSSLAYTGSFIAAIPRKSEQAFSSVFVSSWYSPAASSSNLQRRIRKPSRTACSSIWDNSSPCLSSCWGCIACIKALPPSLSAKDFVQYLSRVVFMA